MSDVIKKVKFSDVNLEDSFFDSLRADYPGFDEWFNRKSESEAYILENPELLGFLALKHEIEDDTQINPYFPEKERLKISTLKIDAHGTVLGERFINIVLHKAIELDVEEVYVTLFDKQEGLIRLFEKFGFVYWGNKINGERVYIKNFDLINDNVYLDYPLINIKDVNNYILAIYPKFHTDLFPLSKLTTEKDHLIEDLSFTNTIEKTYLTKMDGVQYIKPGDLIFIYRTADRSSAEYSSVITSVCTAVENRNIEEFISYEDFVEFCGKGTIFSKTQLKKFWVSKEYPYILKMIYNVPLTKRIIRKKLIEDVGIDRKAYAGFISLTNDQAKKILELGEVNESFIIN